MALALTGVAVAPAVGWLVARQTAWSRSDRVLFVAVAAFTAAFFGFGGAMSCAATGLNTVPEHACPDTYAEAGLAYTAGSLGAAIMAASAGVWLALAAWRADR